MDCNTAQQMLVDLLYGELDRTVSTELEEHLAKCSTCSKEYEQMGNLLKLVRTKPAMEPSEEITARILNAATVAAKQRADKNKPSSAWWRWSIMNPAVAAAALAILVASVTLLTVVRQNKSPESKLSQQLLTPQEPLVDKKTRWTKESKAWEVKPSRDLLKKNKPGKAQKDSGLIGGILSKQANSSPSKAIAFSPKQIKPAVSASKSAGSEKKPQDNTVLDEVEKNKMGRMEPDFNASGGAKRKRINRESRSGRKDIDTPFKTFSMDKGPANKKPGSSGKTLVQPSPKPTSDIAAANESEQEATVKGSATIKSTLKGNLAMSGADSPSAASRTSSAEAIQKQVAKPKRRKSRRYKLESVVSKADDYSQTDGDDKAGKNDEKRVQALQEETKSRGMSRQLEEKKKPSPGRYPHAKSLFKSGNCKAAILAIDKALESDPHHPMAADALFDKASCLVKLGKFQKAIQTYKRIEQNYHRRAPEARRQIQRLVQ